MDMSASYHLAEPAGAWSDETHPGSAQAGAQLQAYLALHYEQLRRKLARHLGSKDFAGECLHDAWLKLAGISFASPVKNPEAYVYRMACNIAIDRLRGDRSWQYCADVNGELHELPDAAPGPDIVAEHRSSLAAVDRALQRMPKRSRHVLMALRIDEMSRQEAAACYDLSLRTVDAALRVALEYCAEHLGRAARQGIAS